MSDLEKVKKDGLALRYVKNQTDEICLAAVKQDYFALHFVQARYFKSVVKTLRLLSLFVPKIDETIKKLEKEMTN